MADETTQFILGDAAADALDQPRKRRFFGKRRKLVEKFTSCENCGTALAGEYCSACGQHGIDYRRSVWRVAIDALDSFLNWDTKFLKSVGILLTRPGKLTNDFNAGRRVRYVHPLRLYLLASIAFFLIAKLVDFTGFNDNRAPDLTVEDRAEVDAALAKLTAPDSPIGPEVRARIEAARTRWGTPDAAESPKKRAAFERAMLKLNELGEKEALKPKDVAKVEATLERIDASDAKPDDAGGEVSPSPPPPGVAPSSPAPGVLPSPPAVPTGDYGPIIQFDNDDGKPKDPFGVWIEGRIKEKVGEGGTKATLFLETLRSHVPTMMLFCVPLFAFVLKVLYIRQRRYYVEHLVYALHIHTFVYVAVVVITLLGMGAQRWLPAVQPLLVSLLSLVVLGQVFVSIRRVYRQGWFFTTFKFLLGGFAYLIILVIGVGATAFVTLLLP